MITYTVKYRAPGAKLWNKLKKVVGDGIDETYGFRFFKLSNEELYHVPLIYEVHFSADRAHSIRKRLSEEARQEVR